MVRNGTAERSDMGTLSLGGYRPTRTWSRSDCDRPAGPPSAPELEQGYGWRTGHRAGALSVLFMLATGTGVADTAFRTLSATDVRRYLNSGRDAPTKVNRLEGD